MLMGSNQDK